MFTLIERYENAALYKHNGNGLSVIVWPYVLSSVVGLQLTYLVGSRHETTGITGVAHLLEHLMFKGSKNFDASHDDNIHTLEDRGALLNATTWTDRTNYYEVLLKTDLELALKIEADRMREACLREVDRASEMPVVRNEYERGENDAFQVLYKNIWAMSYLAHPYHHSTIGWKADIEQMSIEDIQKFYHQFYGPNNAVLSLIGDISEEEALALVDKHFSYIKPLENPIPKVYTTEDLQEGERHFVVRRGSHARWIAVAHKAPSAMDRDHLVLQLLGKIISYGQMAYLHRDLIDNGLALGLYVDIHPYHDPGLFATYVNLSFDADPAMVMQRVLDLYKNIKNGLVTQDDLARAKTQFLAEKAFDKDGLMGLLQTVNEGIACGDWKYGLSLSKRVADINLADVSAVAQKYLVDDARVTGFYLPKEEVNV